MFRKRNFFHFRQKRVSKLLLRRFFYFYFKSFLFLSFYFRNSILFLKSLVIYIKHSIFNTNTIQMLFYFIIFRILPFPYFVTEVAVEKHSILNKARCSSYKPHLALFFIFRHSYIPSVYSTHILRIISKPQSNPQKEPSSRSS